MPKNSRILICLCLALCITTSFAAEQEGQSSVGKQVAAFELNDYRGQPHKLSDYAEAPAIAIIFLGTECPLVKQYGPKLQALSEKFAADKVIVLGISSNQQDSISELAQFAKTAGITFPILKDVGNKLADQMSAKRTPEAFLLDKDRRIVYRGRIDDQFTYGIARPKVERSYLIDAITAVLAGKPVETEETQLVGCHIGRILTPDETSNVTYSEHIAPLFQKRCVECHRPGEIGPFSLTSYDDAVGWAAMIREVVSEEKMPPWHADPKIGHWANDARLTTDEKQLIYDWVDAGAPQGDKAKLPPPRTFAEDWRIGKPDDVFYMSPNEYNVPAEGAVKYQYFIIDPKFTEDKWIQAAECRAGNRQVVHHIIVGIVPPGGNRKNVGTVHSEWLTAFAPGAMPLDLPTGLAKFIPAGSKIAFQMHYTPNGKATTDRSCVAFKYADPKTVHKQVGTNKAGNNSFVIPPQAESHPVKGTHQFGENSLILALFPHMHLRGKSFRYSLVYPDGKTEVLLDVPHYDFNWQNAYIFDKPKLAPAGSKMVCDATFDNSEKNLANPDPKATVRWGDQTWEEMMIGYFDMVLADQDLQQKAETRVDQFRAQAKSNPIALSDEVKAKAREALASNEKLDAFGLELRKTFPQLDRICLTTLVDGKVVIENVAQDDAAAGKLASANAGKKVDARISKLATHVKETEPIVHRNLGRESSFDLRYMAQVYSSSIHIPVKIGERSGTINFWSREVDAFPPESVAVLKEAANILQK